LQKSGFGSKCEIKERVEVTFNPLLFFLVGSAGGGDGGHVDDIVDAGTGMQHMHLLRQGKQGESLAGGEVHQRSDSNCEKKSFIGPVHNEREAGRATPAPRTTLAVLDL